MKIYFAWSIRGGRDDVNLYHQIITELQKYAEVLTEHIGTASLTSFGENSTSDTSIHERDIHWLLESDLIVAEVTHPSLWVGYELGRWIENGKNILCLYRIQEGKRLSAMIAWAPNIEIFEYHIFEEIQEFLKRFFKHKKDA